MHAAATSTITEHDGEVAGLTTHWREAPADGTAILFLHGVPTNSAEWKPFLERCGGIAPDLPGFGQSAKRGDFDYCIEGYADWIDAFLADRGIDRLRLVGHDWGAALALGFAQRRPERIERLVVMNAVPLLPGYRWHRIARVWRTRLLGELAMGFTSKTTGRLISREANVTDGPMPEEFLDLAYDHFDQGTQRAILRLYRGAPSEVLEAEGARLETITAPALVLWGDQDPYLPPRFADAYGDRLGSARVRHVDDAGHWPWLDKPAVVDEVCTFLAG